MKEVAISIKAVNQPGVLKEITNLTAKCDINITYTHLFIEKGNIANIYMEFENVANINELIKNIQMLDGVKEIEKPPSISEIYGKRIIIVGGGAQVAQVAHGAITEADRHNIRGEHISIDTIPLVGEKELSDAVSSVGRLPRVSALVLAGSLMGGKISEAVEKVKREHDLIVISLNMPGSVTEKADLVVTDPVQAGVMAVMAVAETAIFDIEKVKHAKF